MFTVLQLCQLVKECATLSCISQSVFLLVNYPMPTVADACLGVSGFVNITDAGTNVTATSDTGACGHISDNQPTHWYLR